MNTPPENKDTSLGFAYAGAAYLFWGVLPLYMKLLSHIDLPEIIAHRVIWSVPIAGMLLLFTGRTTDLFKALRSPKMLAMAALTAALVAVNWTIYVWAITADRALDASLGYYINPIFSVFLSSVVLGETLNRLQKSAVGLAALAVVVLTLEAGTLPLAAIGLTVSWGFYALFKRSLPIGPNQGFMLEVLLLLPFGIGYTIWLGQYGQLAFGSSPTDTLLLLGCGGVTAVPLLIYANGAKGLRLSTIAMMQYIVPTMIFLIAVFVFNEPLGRAKMIAFPLIWLSLAIFSVSLVQQRRKHSS